MDVKASDGLDDAFVPDTKAIFIEVILYFFFFLPSRRKKRRNLYLNADEYFFFFFPKREKRKSTRDTKERCFLLTDKIYTEYIGYWTRR